MSGRIVTTARLSISGRVQGVGYRAAFANEAQMLDLTGWVRNRVDGRVEAVVSGDAHAVARIAAWARRGPRGAVVSTVESQPCEGEFERFDILPTV